MTKIAHRQERKKDVFHIEDLRGYYVYDDALTVDVSVKDRTEITVTDMIETMTVNLPAYELTSNTLETGDGTMTMPLCRSRDLM